MYEGAPDWPEQDRFWRIIEKLRGHHPLHRADRDPRLHEVGHEIPRARPVAPCACWAGRRADQPRGLDVVPRAHRRRPLPDRRHLVADGDRRDHDHAAAGRDHHQAGLGHAAVPGHRGRAGGRRATGSTSGGGFLVHRAAVAGHAAHDLRRRRALPRRSTGAASPAATSPATAPSWTRTATAGSWAGWTTCSTSPATGSARWRSRARWWTTRRWPRRRWWAGPTSSRGRRWRRS